MIILRRFGTETKEKNMDILEKRLSKRLRANLPVNFEQVTLPKRFGETTTKDISATGLRVNTDNFFAPDSTLFVKLRFPEVNRVIEGQARVVWSHRVSFSDQYQAGLEFNDLNPMFKKWLEEYILIHDALGRS